MTKPSRNFHNIIKRLLGNIFDMPTYMFDIVDNNKSVVIIVDNLKLACKIEHITSGNICRIHERGGFNQYQIKFPIKNIFDGGI
jgi:hypothetical protein